MAWIAGRMGHWGLAGLAAGAALILAACSGNSPSGSTASAPGAPAFATVPRDPNTIPTAEVVQGPARQPTSTGLQIDDGCVTGRLPGADRVGQIYGQGVNVVVEADNLQAFSQAVASTSQVACRSGVGRREVERLVATLNGIQGLHVRDYNWPGQ